jgi:hypothetical protein
MLPVLATTLLVVLRTNGLTATTLMFVGAPSLVLALGFWALALRRAVRSGDSKPL